MVAACDRGALARVSLSPILTRCAQQNRFAENMPALHMSTQRIFQDRPTPLLLASVLYAAAMQHPLAEYARMSAFYRQAAIHAIAELVKPQDSPTRHNDMEDLHNVLGIIITGLMSEAWVSETGAWIAIAYHLILNATANTYRVDAKVKKEEWRGVYEGLRVCISRARLLASELIRSGIRRRARFTSDGLPIATTQTITANLPAHNFARSERSMDVPHNYYAHRPVSLFWQSLSNDSGHRTQQTARSRTPRDSSPILGRLEDHSRLGEGT
jgi:hypothetical protein